MKRTPRGGDRQPDGVVYLCFGCAEQVSPLLILDEEFMPTLDDLSDVDQRGEEMVEQLAEKHKEVQGEVADLLAEMAAAVKELKRERDEHTISREHIKELEAKVAQLQGEMRVTLELQDFSTSKQEMRDTLATNAALKANLKQEREEHQACQEHCSALEAQIAQLKDRLGVPHNFEMKHGKFPPTPAELLVEEMSEDLQEAEAHKKKLQRRLDHAIWERDLLKGKCVEHEDHVELLLKRIVELKADSSSKTEVIRAGARGVLGR